MTDYKIEYDYELDKKVDIKIKHHINKYCKEIEQKILSNIKCFKKFRVEYVNFDNDKQLAVYINGTEEYPIIGLDIKAHIEAIGEQKWFMALFTALETSILHELAHAIQQYKGKEFNEDEAENFAYDYSKFGIINKI